MAQKIDLYRLCLSSGFSLRNYPLEGRLLVVLSRPKIIIKDSLDPKRKQFLVKKAIFYLLVYPICQLAIFWDGEEVFFPL